MSFIKRLPLFTLLAGISLAIGFAVPVVYEWTQKPPARSRLPAMEQAALVALLLTVVVCPLVAWLRKPQEPTAAGPRKLQFNLRALFAATTVSAILVAAARWLDASWSSALVAAVAAIVVGWSFLRDAGVRSRTGSLVATLFFPFVWVIAYNVPFGSTSGLAAVIPIGPAILPAELVRAVLDRSLSPDDMLPIAAMIVIGELALGAWLAHRGGKLLIAYLLLVLLFSSLSSLGMHALYRA